LNKGSLKNAYYYFLHPDDLKAVTSRTLFGGRFERCAVAGLVKEQEPNMFETIDLKLSELRKQLEDYAVHDAIGRVEPEDTSSTLRDMKFTNRERARELAAQFQAMKNIEAARAQKQQTMDHTAKGE
jgi:hypothetical protein